LSNTRQLKLSNIHGSQNWDRAFVIVLGLDTSFDCGRYFAKGCRILLHNGGFNRHVVWTEELCVESLRILGG
jgi:hypothetical protein